MLLMHNICRPPAGSIDLDEHFGLPAAEPVFFVADFNAFHPRLGISNRSIVACRHIHGTFVDSGHVVLPNDTVGSTHVKDGSLGLAFASNNSSSPAITLV